MKFLVKRLSHFPRRLIAPSLLLLLIILVPFMASVITSADPVKISVRERLALPSFTHPLGQDEFGRDRLSRILHGGQVSLSVAFAATSLAALVGIAFGLIGAYFRGFFEFITRRMADIILCFPTILLALLVVTLFGPGTLTLIAVLSVLYFPIFARITFSEVLRVAALEFVEASRALGTRAHHIILRTILPNIAGPLLIQFSLTVAATITVESGLSFLGLGIVPPDPSWGQMIRGARGFMTQDPLGIFIPCCALTLTIFSINLFCDRLRDVLDPRGITKRKKSHHTSLEGAAQPIVSARQIAPESVAELDGLRLEVVDKTKGDVPLVEGISLQLREGECCALVGESGSGKSLTALALMGLTPDMIRQTGGNLSLRTKSGQLTALDQLSEAEREKYRGSDLAMIFQDPMTALNPVLKIGKQMVESICVHHNVSWREAKSRALELLELVGINDVEQRFNSYPHQMSGGQRQRVMIAMALSCEPKLLIADEPTTALDVTIQAEIIELLKRLRRDYAHGLSLLFISHNLGVVAQIADRIAVMYCGQIVEEGPARQILKQPRHPYTKGLIASMPAAHETLHSARGDRLHTITGTVPLPHDRPSGCAFRDRCAVAIKLCADKAPDLSSFAEEARFVRCWRAEEVAV